MKEAFKINNLDLSYGEKHVLKNITGENNNGTPKRILHVIFSNNATQYNSNCKYSNIFHDICNNRASLWSVMVII